MIRCKSKNNHRKGNNAMNNLINELTNEYQTWCKENNYPYLSADELLAQTTGDDDMEVFVVDNANDRQWLLDFINRWDAVTSIEGKQ